MLFECSCEATAELLEEAIAKGVALRPKTDTPLVELVSTTTVKPITDLTATLGEEVKAIPMADMAADSNNPLHAGWTDQITERAAEIVNRRVGLMVNTVLPAISELSNAVMGVIKNVPIGEVLPNIERYTACDMINVPDFMDNVRRNTPLSYLAPNVRMDQEPKSTDQLMALLDIGGTTLNTALATATNHIGLDNLWLLWESLFVEGSRTTSEYFMTFDQAVMDRFFGLDYAVLIYVITDKLEGVDKAALRQYREAAAYWITKHTANYNKELAAKKLIRDRSNKSGAVVVNAQVYVEFLQRQGTAELVIGAAASDNSYLTIDSILENEKECTRSYSLLKSSSNLENNIKLNTAFRQAMRDQFMLAFKHQLSDAEKAYFEKSPGAASTAVQKFEDVLTLVNANSADDIYRNVAKILCMSRFYYMDCQCFLDSIDAGCKSGLTPEEAQLRAVLSEISNFVTSMVTV